MFIHLEGTSIPYELRPSKRAWTIRLSVSPEKGLLVHKGRRVSQKAAERFIIEKSDWVIKALDHAKSVPPDPTKRLSIAEIKKYKTDALVLAKERLTHFNQAYGFTYKNVTIRDQKTRWGSCSRKGNLNFNYRIALLQPELVDYIIVHELCHLEQMNHSPKFWDLVSRTIPDHLSHRKALRQNPLRLRS